VFVCVFRYPCSSCIQLNRWTPLFTVGAKDRKDRSKTRLYATDGGAIILLVKFLQEGESKEREALIRY
jgi:hypothetical protein